MQSGKEPVRKTSFQTGLLCSFHSICHKTGKNHRHWKSSPFIVKTVICLMLCASHISKLSTFRKSIRSLTNYRFTANTPGMSASCQWKIAEWLSGSNKCSNEEGNLAKFECKMDWSRTCSITLDNESLPFRELPNPREADVTMMDYPGRIALFTSASIILGICPTYALWKRVIHIWVLRFCQQLRLLIGIGYIHRQQQTTDIL